MTDREIMQQALENICAAKLCEMNSMSSRHEMIRLMDKAITALRERLAREEQEPVAWRTFDGEGGYEFRSYDMNEKYAQEWEQRNPKHKGWVEPLYTAPQPAQQEPVAVVSGYYGGQCVILPIDPARIFNSNTAIYTSPPAQRKPLTDGQLADLWYKQSTDWMEFARTIEAAHGIGEKPDAP